MRRSFLFALALLLELSNVAVSAQTLQQDRRIEEEKREDLKPTVETPGAVPATPSAQQVREAPVPPPIAALYFAMLAQKRIVFRYDAAKAIVVLMGMDEEHIDLASQVAYLQAQGFLSARKAQAFDPMQPLRRGEMAYMFQQALKIKGGIALHLFGWSERYTLKELAFRGFASPGHVHDLVDGAEFIQLMTQAADYKAKQEAKQKP